MPDIDMDFADDRRDEVHPVRASNATGATGSRRSSRSARCWRAPRFATWAGRSTTRSTKSTAWPSWCRSPIGLKIADGARTEPRAEGAVRRAAAHQATDRHRAQRRGRRAPRAHARRGRGRRRSSRCRTTCRCSAPTAGDSAMTQYDMKVLDKIGLLKMDFLGLANLTIIDDAAADGRDVPGRSSSTSTRFRSTTPRRTSCSARPTRMASSSSRRRRQTRILIDMQPKCLEDMGVAVALNRPGPIEGGATGAGCGASGARSRSRTCSRSSNRSSRRHTASILYQDQVMRIALSRRRLHARRSRRPARRDGQEGQGQDGQAARAVPERRCRTRRRA